ncbi:hypothetical protein GCK72_011262 [Caenorhabditis remanei]|uniref:Uncharacterized protein n=1 Tax=Caenorhabditis remanei TaxID=31234 RepID=A0A6A5H730_CAERE|nr:hypothetical protein GCK72_011262 [Caenorhabditis remanei]KAF1762997.1 hypothetical protein GCK72_011262 [Caenorhabditis remanei]
MKRLERLLDADCRTALSFSEELREHTEQAIIEEMGRRAKARRRAARVAAENQVAGLETADEPSSVLSDETNCEIPSLPNKPSPSRIPIFQKGYQVEKPAVSPSEKPDLISTSPSKIPRPMTNNLIYLKPIDNSDNSENENDFSASTAMSELPSYTDLGGSTFSNFSSDMITGSHDATICGKISPLPACDILSQFSTVTDPTVDKNQVKVIAEANGVELQLDVSALMTEIGLEFSGIRLT